MSNRPTNKSECITALTKALNSEEGLSELEVLPLLPLVIDTARRNRKHFPYVKFAVPEEWIKDIRGGFALADDYLVVRLPVARATSALTTT